MKKTLLVFIFLTAGLVVLGEEITLDTLLERITETSYRKEMYELEQKKTEALEKFYKIDTTIQKEYTEQQEEQNLEIYT